MKEIRVQRSDKGGNKEIEMRRTAGVILQNLSTGSFPLTTLVRRPGFALSLRLRKRERILALYSFPKSPLWSDNTVLSIAEAFFKMASVAVEVMWDQKEYEEIVCVVLK